MTLTFNDYTWRLDPRVSEEDLRAVLERFPRLETLPGARVIKENQLRTVVYVPEVGVAARSSGPSGVRALIAKLYRYRSPLERLRYRFRRTRAEQEWYALNRFEALELPAAVPLAVAQCHRGGRLEGEGLLLEYLPGCRSLVEALEADRPATPSRAGGFLPPGELSAGQRATIELAARSVRRLHDRGAWHRDLHAGNVLIDASRDLFFIDLHSCWFRRRLRRWQRWPGVLNLLHSLSRTVPPDGIDLFLDAYGRDVLFGTATRETVWRRLRRDLDSRERKRLESRSKRCLRRSTMFDVAKEGATRTYHLRSCSRKELAALWRHDPPGKVLKRSRCGWVAEARAAERDVCVKYCAYTWPESLRSLLEVHRLRRAYSVGHALWVRGIASPRVIALHERRPLGCVREAHLVTELIPGATPLDRYLMDEYWGKRLRSGASSRRKHDLARRIGRFVRALHDARISAGDLSPQNLLVTAGSAETPGDDGPPALYLVDLDDARVAERATLRERGRNLVQLGNLPEGHITTADLLRALREYAAGDERYWNRHWIRELREALLEEHLRVVVRRAAGEREQAR